MLHIADIPGQSKERFWRYPEDKASTIPLTGALGTECLLVIGSNKKLIQTDRIPKLWGNPEWAILPQTTVMRLNNSKVVVEQHSRDLGAPQKSGISPSEQIAKTLETFTSALVEDFPFIEGIVFSHIASVNKE